jgi:hypothetical protein
MKVRKRRTIKKTTAAKTAELEEKLDGLVSLFTAATRSLSTGPSKASPYPDISNSEEFQNITNSFDAANERRESFEKSPIESQYYSQRHHLPTSAVIGTASDTTSTRNIDCESSGAVLCSTEGEDCLNIFRDSFLPQYPFILIPESITARMLLEERPFLLMCIVSVCSKSIPHQTALGIEIREILGRKTLIEGEKSLVSRRFV